MSEQIVKDGAEKKPVELVKAFALAQTGSITDSGQYVSFAAENGEKLPVVLFIHQDEHKVRKRKAAVQRTLDKIKEYNGQPARMGQAILGVIPVTVPKPKEPKPKSSAAPTNTGGTAGSPTPPSAKSPKK